MHSSLFSAGLLFFLALGVASCTPSPTTPSSAPPKNLVLAKIGKTTLSLAAFEQAYRTSASGLSPQDFLDAMITEEILAQEAQSHGLFKARQVQEATRKALIQQLLKEDFEKWFTKESVPAALVQAYFRDFNSRYNAPELLKVVHFLVRFPLSPRDKPTALEAALWKEWKPLYHAAAQRYLAAFEKENPTKVEHFERFSKRLREVGQAPDPRLLALLPRLRTIFVQAHGQPKDALRAPLRAFGDGLKTLASCLRCFSFHKAIERWLETQEISSKPLEASDHADLFKQLESEAKDERSLVLFEELPLFADTTQTGHNFPTMVEPFSKAAFALPDGGRSRSLVETVFGYHLIFRQRLVPAKRTTFEQVSESIRQMLFERMRSGQYAKWLERLIQIHPIKLYPNHMERIQR